MQVSLEWPWRQWTQMDRVVLTIRARLDSFGVVEIRRAWLC